MNERIRRYINAGGTLIILTTIAVGCTIENQALPTPAQKANSAPAASPSERPTMTAMIVPTLDRALAIMRAKTPTTSLGEQQYAASKAKTPAASPTIPIGTGYCVALGHSSSNEQC